MNYLAVPDWYWQDDCPCALAGEYQDDCTTCYRFPIDS